MGSHLLQTQQRLEDRLQLAPGAGKVWFDCVCPAEEEKNPTSKEGQAVKKEVKEAAEERSGLPG